MLGEISKSSYLPPKRPRRYRNNLLEEAQKQRKLHLTQKVRMFFVYTYDVEHLDILINEGIELWQRNEIKLNKFDYEGAGFFEDGEEHIIPWEDDEWSVVKIDCRTHVTVHFSTFRLRRRERVKRLILGLFSVEIFKSGGQKGG